MTRQTKIFILSFCFALVFFILPATAGVIYDIVQDEVNGYVQLGTGSPDWVAQSFIPSATSFYGADFVACRSGTLTGNMFFRLCYNDGAGAWRCDLDIASSTIYAPELNSTFEECTEEVINWSTWRTPEIATTSSDYYSLQMQYSGTTDYIRIWRATGTDPYPDGYLATRNSGTATTIDYPDDDLTFKTISQGQTLEWVNPVQGLITEDFGAWILKYNLGTSATGILRIGHKPVSTGELEFAYYPVYSELNGEDVSFVKQFPLYATDWLAIAQLYTDSPEIPDATESITFDVINPYGEYGAPTSTDTSGDWVFTCDSADDAFSRSICYLFQWLFKPSNIVLQKFGNLADDLSDKPPFAYFRELSETLQNINNYQNPLLNFGLNFTYLENFFGAIRTAMSIILWLLAITYFFIRIRNLHL